MFLFLQLQFPGPGHSLCGPACLPAHTRPGEPPSTAAVTAAAAAAAAAAAQKDPRASPVEQRCRGHRVPSASGPSPPAGRTLSRRGIQHAVCLAGLSLASRALDSDQCCDSVPRARTNACQRQRKKHLSPFWRTKSGRPAGSSKLCYLLYRATRLTGLHPSISSTPAPSPVLPINPESSGQRRKGKGKRDPRQQERVGAASCKCFSLDAEW